MQSKKHLAVNGKNIARGRGRWIKRKSYHLWIAVNAVSMSSDVIVVIAISERMMK